MFFFLDPSSLPLFYGDLPSSRKTGLNRPAYRFLMPLLVGFQRRATSLDGNKVGSARNDFTCPSHEGDVDLLPMPTGKLVHWQWRRKINRNVKLAVILTAVLEFVDSPTSSRFISDNEHVGRRRHPALLPRNVAVVWIGKVARS